MDAGPVRVRSVHHFELLQVTHRRGLENLAEHAVKGAGAQDVEVHAHLRDRSTSDQTADGQVHEFEGDIVARVAELLDVPETDVATVRRVAAGKGTS